MWPVRMLLPGTSTFHVDPSVPSARLVRTEASGAVMVVVLGMLVLAVGVRLWLVTAAVGFGVLGVLGQSVTYHYFTDAVGSILLGTSLVCAFAAVLRLLSLRR